ncbi:hypothetical protein D3C71_1932120 [compost metagenome]
MALRVSPFTTVTNTAALTTGPVTVISSSTPATPAMLPAARMIFSFSSWLATSPLRMILSPSTVAVMFGLPKPTFSTCFFSCSSALALPGVSRSINFSPASFTKLNRLIALSL